MKVILLEDIKNLGRQGEVVTVASGYARNFILPKKKGVEADHSNVNVIEQQKKLAEKRALTELGGASALQAQLAQTTLKFALKSGENDKLYGSVTSADISDKLQEQGITIDKRDIIHDEAIKTLGEFDVKIKLHKDVIGVVKVIVEKLEETN